MKQADLGSMLLATVRYTLRCNGAYTAEYAGTLVRRHFSGCDDYDKRQIVTEIEIAVAVPRDVIPPSDIPLWEALVEEIRPPKAPFTVDYRCGKCKAVDLKLWRGVHGCELDGGAKLLCARCLAPEVEVDADGRAPCDILSGEKTDQVEGGLPAIPTDDTFWGYSSVPTADVRWWRALPTYPAVQRHGKAEDT